MKNQTVARLGRLMLMVALVSGFALLGRSIATPVAHASAAVNVSVGYADSLRGTPSFPVPWQGSPNTIFVGSGFPWDAGAIKVDNTTAGPITVDYVQALVPCYSGVPQNPWGGPFTLLAGQSLIVTQTYQYNFDTSDPGCNYGCPQPDLNPANAPTVTVSVNGVAQNYTDSQRVLDTKGYDVACNGSNESQAWSIIGSVTTGNSTLTIGPPNQTRPVNDSATVVANLLDGSGNPLPNVTVNFTVLGGPDAGMKGSGNTDASGNAQFTYTNNGTLGTDDVQACFTNASGFTTCNNPPDALVTWVAQCVAPTITLKSVTTNGSGQKVLTFAVQDTATGLDAGMTLTGTNILPPTTNPNPYMNGTTGEVDAIFTKANQALSSTATVTATSGTCSTTKDPLLTSTMREQGKPQTDTYSGIAQSESLLTVYNGAPGVDTMKLSVNGKSFQLHGMKDGDQQSVSIASALTSGTNTISVTSTGRPGGSAVLLVAPPK